MAVSAEPRWPPRPPPAWGRGGLGSPGGQIKPLGVERSLLVVVGLLHALCVLDGSDVDDLRGCVLGGGVGGLAEAHLQDGVKGGELVPALLALPAHAPAVHLPGVRGEDSRHPHHTWYLTPPTSHLPPHLCEPPQPLPPLAQQPVRGHHSSVPPSLTGGGVWGGCSVKV